jgi:hypothetical protein
MACIQKLVPVGQLGGGIQYILCGSQQLFLVTIKERLARLHGLILLACQRKGLGVQQVGGGVGLCSDGAMTVMLQDGLPPGKTVLQLSTGNPFKVLSIRTRTAMEENGILKGISFGWRPGLCK